MERLVSSVKVAYRKFFGCCRAKPDELRMLLYDVKAKKSDRQLTIVTTADVGALTNQTGIFIILQLRPRGKASAGRQPCDQTALKMEKLEKSGRALVDALDAGILCDFLHPKVGDVVLVFELNTPVLSHSLDRLWSCTSVTTT
ncbi:hypothetical protein T07_15050 [Trichinella nelsoni]|uniref:Uncharacterized protein n=1 Tax=Trichinella nelsoni TaxID=6336 RepID=A0A0V0RTA2_9BILA|nr:hypothetical protein T07_15050 [Trichinella nelsoni]